MKLSPLDKSLLTEIELATSNNDPVVVENQSTKELESHDPTAPAVSDNPTSESAAQSGEVETEQPPLDLPLTSQNPKDEHESLESKISEEFGSDPPPLSPVPISQAPGDSVPPVGQSAVQPTQIKCPECDSAYALLELLKHVKLVHGNHLFTKWRISEAALEHMPLKCAYCEYSFLKESVLQKHREERYGKEGKITKCERNAKMVRRFRKKERKSREKSQMHSESDSGCFVKLHIKSYTFVYFNFRETGTFNSAFRNTYLFTNP